VQKRAFLIAVALTFVGLLAAPKGAWACERCGIILVCIGESCYMGTGCVNPSFPQSSRDECWIDQFGLCNTAGDFCAWAQLEIERENPEGLLPWQVEPCEATA
jgi:hypothetical protein